MNIITRSGQCGSWEPFRELERMQNNIFSLFDSAVPRAGAAAGRQDADASLWGPAVDVQDSADKVVVKADLPGVDRKDVEVSVEGAVLVIRGEKKEEHKTRDKGYLRTERAYGSFARVVELPVEVDEAKVSAQYKDGVLEVTLPKREEAKPRVRKVEIK
jgi:HSP20 family protein